MSFIYLSQGFVIYPHRQVIVLGDETIQVRPKTFALLLLLLAKPREVLSKSLLLDTIWDDVEVEEQVLVQSIRELRQLFRNSEIIQTYPRKGYAWAGDVERQAEATLHLTPAGTECEAPSSTAIPKKRRKNLEGKTLAGVAALTLLLVMAVIMLHKRPAAQTQTEVVMVLPIKNQVPGNDHNWVPLGGMDQLINLLAPSQTVQVMTTEYILQIMRNAEVPRIYESEQVGQIFSVSGATLLVESQLSGTVENYRLDYKLRTRNDIKRGAIFDKDLNQAIHQLAGVIGSHTGQKLYSDRKAETVFGNELMARALEQLDQQQLEPALSLFTSLKQLEPKNIMARKKLIEILIGLRKFEQAKVEIDEAMAMSNTDNYHEMTKISYLLAMLYLEQGDKSQALVALDQSDRYAILSNNILYRSNIAFVRGDIYEQNEAWSQAQLAYEQAMQLDGSIRCPIGVSVSHIRLAKLFAKQDKSVLALEHYSAAKQLIEQNQLHDLEGDLAAAKP